MKHLLMLIYIALTVACAPKKSEVFSGPTVIISGITYDKETMKPVTGVVKELYRDGQLKASVNYIDGIKSGLAWRYPNNPNPTNSIDYVLAVSQIKTTCYQNGKKVGMSNCEAP